MELQGKIIAVCDRKSGVSQTTGNAWTTQEFVVEETKDRYPQRMCFSVFGEEKLNNWVGLLQVGAFVRVHFDIDAREHNGRWFTSINAWKVEAALEQATMQQAQQAQQEAQQAAVNAVYAQAAPQAPQVPQAAPQAPQVAPTGGDELPF